MGALGNTTQSNYPGIFNPFPGPYHPDYLSQQSATTPADALPFASVDNIETETKEELDRFCDAMREIREEMVREPEKLRSAPHTMPVRRLDDVRAVKQLDIAWKPAP